MVCDRCSSAAVEWIRYSGEHLCRDHFLGFVERRAKRELRSQVNLRGNERIAIGMSGGKDSSTTAALLGLTGLFTMEGWLYSIRTTRTSVTGSRTRMSITIRPRNENRRCAWRSTSFTMR